MSWTSCPTVIQFCRTVERVSKLKHPICQLTLYLKRGLIKPYILIYFTVMYRDAKLVVFNLCAFDIFSNLDEGSKNLHALTPLLSVSFLVYYKEVGLLRRISHLIDHRQEFFCRLKQSYLLSLHPHLNVNRTVN